MHVVLLSQCLYPQDNTASPANELLPSPISRRPSIASSPKAFGTIVQESLDGTFLSDDEKRLNKVQTTLAKFDDGDGMIDAGEMGRALQAMGFSSLRAAFEVLFGVGANDVFPVRDRIRMWQTTKGMMKDTFDSLMANRQYEACKVMKSRMDVFDQQFESMHTEDTGRHRVAEEKNFHKACRIVRTKAETAYTKTQTKVADFAERKVAELAEVQSRDIQELDIRVSKFPCPSRLSTTQMLALKASERNLAQRGKFEEAGVMRKAVNVLQAPERAAFMDEEAKRIAAMKSVLRKSHEREKETLRRHLVDKEMGNTRTYERDVRDRNEKAITFLRRDMNHAQTVRPAKARTSAKRTIQVGQ